MYLHPVSVVFYNGTIMYCFPLQMLALRMQATSDQVKQQPEISLYSSSSDASDCGGSDGDESAEESDGGKVFRCYHALHGVLYTR